MIHGRRNLARCVWALALLTVVSIPSATAQSRPKPQQPFSAKEEEREYIIGPEDVLDISVWDNQQLTRTVPVRPDGKISLPLLNDLKAAGLTPMQLRAQLVTALTPFIPNATVSVIVRDIHSQKVTVMGEVKQPGRYELHSRSTVLDALALAGGFTEYAARGRVLVLRRRGTTTYQMGFQFNKVVDGDLAAQPNFELEPGDIILVP
jgi:polysaccharide export outer membrane protein